MGVMIETKSMLATLDKSYDRGVILYFTFKLPLVSSIKLWFNSFITPNCVEHVYASPRGFLMWFSDCQNIVLL